MHDTTINDWLDRLELQDPGSRGHAERVAIYALALGQKLGLSSDELQQLRWLLRHDHRDIPFVAGDLTALHRARQLVGNGVRSDDDGQWTVIGASAQLAHRFQR